MNKKDILEFIKNPLFINFSTVNGQGFPETRAVVNLRNENIAPHLTEFFKHSDKIYIMTNTSSAKISQIINNHKTSLYISDNDKFKGLLLLGKAFEVIDKDTKKKLWDDSWNFYYKGGLEGGDFSILEFVAQEYKFYENLSVVDEKIDW